MSKYSIPIECIKSSDEAVIPSLYNFYSCEFHSIPVSGYCTKSLSSQHIDLIQFSYNKICCVSTAPVDYLRKHSRKNK